MQNENLSNLYNQKLTNSESLILIWLLCGREIIISNRKNANIAIVKHLDGMYTYIYISTVEEVLKRKLVENKDNKLHLTPLGKQEGEMIIKNVGGTVYNTEHINKLKFPSHWKHI